jgi:hypothetical protein
VGEMLYTRYEVLRTLGKGKNGEALLCKDHRLDRLVALKRSLDCGKIIEPAEARNAAKLEHPNSVRVYDFADDYSYLVSEYIEGETLQQRIDQDAEAVRANFFEIAHGLVSGLIALKHAGLVHRDLKPANILFRVGSWNPLINDYGLSVRLDDTRRPINLAWRYMPIEAWEEWNSESPDFTDSDTWDLHSLGVIFFEIWTGKLPYGEGGKEAIGLKVAHGDPDAIPPGVAPTSLPNLVRRMIVKRTRPRSLAEVEAELSWIASSGGHRVARLDDFRQYVQHIYGERNVGLHALDFAAHIGGNFKEALRCLEDEPGSEALRQRFIPRLLAWLCALCMRLNYTPSEVFAFKYGDLCPYCHRRPCASDCAGSAPAARNDLLRRVESGHYEEVYADRTWRQFRDALADVYGERNRDDYTRFHLESLRAAISLTEAVSRAPQLEGKDRVFVALSLATVFARYLGVLALLGPEFDLEAEFVRLYGEGCPDCQLTPCGCGARGASASITELA